MSGFCGWIGEFEPGEDRPKTLERMAAALAQANGPAAPTSQCEGRFGLAARGAEDTVSLSTSGEIWAACDGVPRWTTPDLADLAAAESPAAALANAYRRYGADMFKHMQGHFAGVVVDTQTGRAAMAVDRFGVRPLAYAEVPGGIVFGSSTRAVAAHPAVAKALSMQALYNYLVFYRVPAPHTAFAAQRKLRTGECLCFTPEDGPKTHFYWRMQYEPDGAAEPDLTAALQEKVSAAVERSVTAGNGDNLGSFLSGGLDSSTVTAVYARHMGEKAHTFSIGFDRAEYDETPYARLAARTFGTDHHEYFVTDDDVLKFIRQAAEAFDEPFGNASVVPVYYCARLARDSGIKTLLAGDGGDEMFAGNPHYRRMMVFEAYQKVPAAVRGLLFRCGVARHLKNMPLPFLRKAGRYIEQAEVPLPDRLELDNPYLGPDVRAIFHPDRVAEIDTAEPWHIMREAYERPETGTALQRMMHLDLQMVLADGDIRKVNQMCGMAGLDVRYPMLDDDLLALSGRIPPGLLMKGYRLRHFYKEAFKDLLPKDIIDKPKHGFGLPSGEAMREYGPLTEMATESIDHFRDRGILNERFLDQVREALHASEPNPYLLSAVWDVMVLEMWLQSHIDAGSGG